MDENFIGPIKHRRGDVRADGLLFWCYHHGHERWFSREHIVKLQDAQRRKTFAWRKKLQTEFPKKYRDYLDRVAKQAAAHRATKARVGESEEQRATRLEAKRKRARRRKERETPEQAEQRKAKRREYLKRVTREKGPAHEARKAAHQRWLAKGDNRKRSNEKAAEWHRENAGIVKQKSREYYQVNKAAMMERMKHYRRKRCATDPAFRVMCSLRARVAAVLKGKQRMETSKELLGDGFKERILEQMRGSMTLDNFGKVWQIDHIVPCAWFNAEDEHERRAAFHWSNLRPEYGLVNRSKGARCTEADLDFVLARCPASHRTVLEKFRAKARACAPYHRPDVHSPTEP